MASAILSRFLPPGPGEPSIYEALRENEETSDQSDIEERAGMALDEENLGEGFQDYELDDAIVNEAASPTTLSRIESSNKMQSASVRKGPSRDRRSLRKPIHEDMNDDVPQSLLFEGDDGITEAGQDRPSKITPPVPSKATIDTQAQWRKAQQEQLLHPLSDRRSPQSRSKPRGTQISTPAHPREQAMWRWANVENLDNFLKDVYDYFLGNGIKCILLSRALNLL